MNASSKSKRIKLVFGIIIPVLVLVTTIVMVSISFAWFSQETEASVQSINLSTQKAFVLEFSSNGKTDNMLYMGQTALSPGDGQVYSENNIIDGYYDDLPFYFVTQLNINADEGVDADGNAVGKNLQLQLENIEILNGSSYMDIYNEEGDSNSETPEGAKIHKNSNVNLAFTWFFKKHTDTDVVVNKDENGKLRRIIPQTEIWYTPYGTFEFEGGELVKVDGKAKPENISDINIGNHNISNFKEHGTFDFYIIFAPEKAYWSQYFTALQVQNAYDEDQLSEMLGVTVTQADIANDLTKSKSIKIQMYYSDLKYMGSTFRFGASLTVIDMV